MDSGNANLMVGVSSTCLVVDYSFSDLGARVKQTVNGEPETYLLDMAGGLTQVLEDETDAYLYGVGRISQQGITVTEYFLGDALGSVRQLADEDGEVTLAKSYDPYGKVLYSGGDGESSYGFTNEWTDTTGLVYLRSRYYAPAQGRFIARDMWEGDYTRPLSLNEWIYVEANPANYKDPAGNYISPYSKAGIPCPIQDAVGWIQISKGVWIFQPSNPVNCGRPSGSSPGGQGKSKHKPPGRPKREETGNQVARYIVQRIREDSNSQAIKAIYRLNNTHSYETACNIYDQMSWWEKLNVGGDQFLTVAYNADYSSHLNASAWFGCLVADAKSRPVCGQWDYKENIGEIWGTYQTVDFSVIGINEKVIFYYSITVQHLH